MTKCVTSEGQRLMDRKRRGWAELGTWECVRYGCAETTPRTESCLRQQLSFNQTKHHSGLHTGRLTLPVSAIDSSVPSLAQGSSPATLPTNTSSSHIFGWTIKTSSLSLTSHIFTRRQIQACRFASPKKSGKKDRPGHKFIFFLSTVSAPSFLLENYHLPRSVQVILVGQAYHPASSTRLQALGHND